MRYIDLHEISHGPSSKQYEGNCANYRDGRKNMFLPKVLLKVVYGLQDTSYEPSNGSLGMFIY